MDNLTITFNTTSINMIQSLATAAAAAPLPINRGLDDDDYDDPNNFVSNA